VAYEVKKMRHMNMDTESKYNYYPEQIVKVMVEQELIFEEDIPDIQLFIRGCA
jgi:hypothetical protein